MNPKSFSVFLLIAFLFFSCSQTSVKNEKQYDATDTNLTNFSASDTLIPEDGIPIYYNMYLTVEITSFFESEGATYNEELLNPVTNVNNYITSSEKALNLGVYAVDLTYARVFEQFQKAGSYFSSMYKLAEELGIPEEFIYSSADRLERNLTEKDSLRAIANEVYSATEYFLKANNRESATALIVLGGWIETIYLASEIFDLDADNEDLEYMQRIEEQKISLDQLINLLAPYRSDDVIRSMHSKLLDLQPVYNTFEINKDQIETSISQLNAINQKVEEIRNQIIG